MAKFILLLISHSVVAALAFALGIYMLPILTAPASPTEQDIIHVSTQAVYQTQLTKDLKGSDALHWGQGSLFLTQSQAALAGKLAPGPDYKLYFSPQFVETEAEFNKLKSRMIEVADVKTFDNFIVTFNQSINLADYNTVVVWCESFQQFITAAKYR